MSAEPIAFVRKRYLERMRAEAAWARRSASQCPLCDGEGVHAPDCLIAKTIAEVKGGLR